MEVAGGRTVVALLCLALSFVGAVAVPSGAAATTIERIRYTSGRDYTRVVIDVDGRAGYQAAFLRPEPARNRPSRFYLDLDGVRVAPGISETAIGDARVRTVRVGQYTRHTARVVMDLASPVTPKVFSLDSPPRIVIDLSDKKKAVVPAAPSAPTRTVAVASPRRLSPIARPSAPLLRTYVIAIDPGHGGRDPGARGLKGESEKAIVSDISRRVSEKLRRGMRAEVVLTRRTDNYVSLAERKNLANRKNADIFVSIHANASRNRKAHGIETYYLKNTNDRATLRLARLENGVDSLLKGSDVSRDADLSYILSDMVQGYKESDSILLARHIQKELVRHVSTRYKMVRDLGAKQGPFYVLDGTYMPSVLVETAFLTHPEEGGRIRSEAYREALAEGIYRGIKRYLEDDRIAGVY